MRFFIVLCTIIFSLPTFAYNASAGKNNTKKLNIQALSLQKSYLQTIDCRDSKRLSNLLQASLKEIDNLATKGKNASVFEEIIMNNPSCFIQAVNALPSKVCRQIESQFIHETFFYPRDEIKAALSSSQHYDESCLAG